MNFKQRDINRIQLNNNTHSVVHRFKNITFKKDDIELYF